MVLAWAAGRLSELRRDIVALSRRITALEQARSAPHATPAVVAAAEAPAPSHVAPAALPHATPAPSAPARGHPPLPATRPADAEQWIGAVGLQNAGAVLLLVGFFFLVLW